MTPPVTAIVLAGGLSRRMGGGDKGLLMLGGRTMLAHVIDRLRPQVAALAVNANGDPARFAGFGLPVVPDTMDGFLGPLAGVLAGLRWSAHNVPAATHMVTAAGDAPLLPPDLVDRLLAPLQAEPRSIALARSAGELHPVIGAWPVALADDLEAQLRAGVRKVLRWTDRHGTIGVDFPMLPTPGGEIDPFYNANTPEELEALRVRLGGGVQA